MRCFSVTRRESSTKKSAIQFAGWMVLLIGNFSLAQESDTASNEINEDEIERIIVSSQGLNPAMEAFNSGNYELAEIKFMENEKCAHRKERNRQAFLEGVRESQISQEVSGGGVNTGSSMTDSNASRVEGNTPFSSSSKRASRQGLSKEDIRCSNRSFQFYMAGMSQLQLGRTEDAENSFERAVALNQNEYDAHYRLALMKLLRDDSASAKEHMESIQDMLRRCYKCDVRDEILTRIAYLEKALNGEISLK